MECRLCCGEFIEPKVTSTLIQLKPKPGATEIPSRLLEEVTRAAFGQRRKMVRQSLKSLGVPMEALLSETGLRGDERAEELDVAMFLKIGSAVRGLRLRA